MFGFIFRKCCVDVHEVGQVEMSSLTLELSPCRPLIPNYIVLDDLGEFHIVSFVGVRLCVQESSIPMLCILLVPPMCSFCQYSGWSCGNYFTEWSRMGIFLSDLCTWYFSCRMLLLRCSVFFHVGGCFCLYF